MGTQLTSEPGVKVRFSLVESMVSVRMQPPEEPFLVKHEGKLMRDMPEKFWAQGHQW